MSATPHLGTPYALPYSVLLQSPPLLSDGSSIQLTVDLPLFPSTEQIDSVASNLPPLMLLAQTGALGGDSIPPWLSTIEDDHGPRLIGQSLQWTLDVCRLDERAAIVFAHLFLLAQGCPVKRVELRKAGDPRPCYPLAFDPDLDHPYPPRWRELPFLVEIDPDIESGNRNLTLRFGQVLSADQAEEIEVRLQCWGSAGLLGLYAPAPTLPLVPAMFPDDTIVLLDDELEWSIKKFNSHPDAIDGLVNACVAIHHDTCPITSLHIEG